MSIAGVPVHNYRSDAQEWVIQFKAGVTNSAMRQACKGKCTFVGHPDEAGNAFIQVNGGESVVTEIASENSAVIEFLTPDETQYVIPEMTNSDEEEDRSAWTRRRQPSTQWNLESVGAGSAPNRGRGTHIYVFDTGVRVSHQEFGGRAVPTLDLTTGGLVECNGDATCAADKMGHGTHCAGTAGGRKYGVARDADIHAVKVLKDNGSGNSGWAVTAMDWVVSKGARPAVISMSISKAEVWTPYKAAIDSATSAGVVVVVGAGNSNKDSCQFSPAYVPSAITVAATRQTHAKPPNARAGYSNWGACNDIFAPGSDIESSSMWDDSITSTLSGTNMAAPHVSGAAAILLTTDAGLGSSGVMQSFMRSGKRGVIRDMHRPDPDLFLYIGQ